MSDGSSGGSSEASRPGLKLRSPRYQDLEIDLTTVEDAGSRARLEQVRQLAELHRLRREQRVHISPFFEPRAGWENQMIHIEEGRPLWTCTLATLRNALISTGIYDSATDTEEQMVQEVRDLFRPGGLNEVEAFTRLLTNRPQKGVSLYSYNFQQMLGVLLKDRPVMYGRRGHMVLLTGGIRAVTFKDQAGDRIVLGTRQVDPLNAERRSTFEPLAKIAEQGGFYHSLGRQIKLPARK